MAPGANEQNIALIDPKVPEFFSRFEVLGVNRIAQFQPFDFFGARYIKQDTAAHYAVAGYIDRTPTGTETADLALAEAIVHFTLPEHVAERVEMSKRHPMRRNCEIIQR